MVICLELGADLHMAQLMPLPLTVSCFSKIQIVFTFLVRAHPDGPGQRAVKRVCVCVCVLCLVCIFACSCVSFDHFDFVLSNLVLLSFVFFRADKRAYIVFSVPSQEIVWEKCLQNDYFVLHGT